MAAEQLRVAAPIERLPEELYDEILSHLRVPYIDNTSTERWFVEYDRFLNAPKRAAFDLTLRHFDDYERAPQDLHNVRLSCKALYHAATRALFRRCFTVLRPYMKFDINAIEELASERGHLSLLSGEMRRIHFDLQPDKWDHHGCIFFGAKRDGYVKSFETFMASFPSIMRKLGNLESLQLSLSGPEWNGHRRNAVRTITFDYDILTVDSLVWGLVTVFSAPGLDYLTDLRLTLPCAHDFAAINLAFSNERCFRMKRLFLEYADATGPGGSKQYLYGDGQFEEGDEDVPYSNLQERNANQENMHHIRDVVSRCTNLESLGLSGTQHLDANLLQWSPAPGKGLKSLYLSRVRLDADRLIHLYSYLEGSPTSESPIVSSFLHDVQLSKGTWETVFKGLIDCPNLSYFVPSDLDYVRGHPFKQYPCRPWEDSSIIWSDSMNDEDTLKALDDVLAGRCANLGVRHAAIYPDW
ncbi:hypothetical protein CC80DRAFT_548973 [Byssothecium circinans]|uniref:Uncharacterized protein n=1 Tax=Byssothecium circinans TaxID=147558 RepID=A0A6A5TTC9_9PLEO|nr:hypothetical protein CC80DRAFT_548973 [Byssothecium circinans]